MLLGTTLTAGPYGDAERGMGGLQARHKIRVLARKACNFGSRLGSSSDRQRGRSGAESGGQAKVGLNLVIELQQFALETLSSAEPFSGPEPTASETPRRPDGARRTG